MSKLMQSQRKTDERETSSTSMVCLTKPSTQIAIVSPLINIAKCEICQADFSALHNPKREIENHIYRQRNILVNGQGKLCGFCNYSSSSLVSTINHISCKHKGRFQDEADSRKLTLLSTPTTLLYDSSDDECALDDPLQYP
jgi:hypothetical protein